MAPLGYPEYFQLTLLQLLFFILGLRLQSVIISRKRDKASKEYNENLEGPSQMIVCCRISYNLSTAVKANKTYELNL